MEPKNEVNAKVRAGPRKELVQMGYKPYMKMLPPKIVEYLVEQFCINFEKSHEKSAKSQL